MKNKLRKISVVGLFISAIAVLGGSYWKIISHGQAGNTLLLVALVTAFVSTTTFAFATKKHQLKKS